MIKYDNQAIGYIQTYFVNDYPDYSKYVEVEDSVAGLNLFIGEECFIHRGLGKIIIKKFLNDIVFKDPKVTSCVLGPEPDNIIAIKTYEKVGFKYIKTIQIPDENEPEIIMELKREEFVSES